MRIIQADCGVEYSGRGKTTSSRGNRLIMLKSDGTVLIHRDKGIIAMNYMGGTKKSDVTESIVDGQLHIIAKANDETIDVTIYDMAFDMTFDDMDEEGDALTRHGTERQMQAWLSRQTNFSSTFGDGCTFLEREWQTGKGPVDLLGIDPDGRLMLIETKRRAKMSDVYQVVRYETAVHNEYERLAAIGETSIKVGRRGEHVIPIIAMEAPLSFLVCSRNDSKVADECVEHGVSLIHIKDEWVDDEAPNEMARVTTTTARHETGIQETSW